MRSSESSPPVAFAAESFFGMSPSRSPRWRWQRAERLLRDGERPGSCDDALTGELFDLLLAMQGSAPDDARQAALQTLAGQALVIWQEGREQRDELEARLLANESDEAISGKMALAPPVILAYHDFFFEVRRMLTAGDWIRAAVLGPATGGITEGAIWREYAWLRGSDALDILINDFRGRPSPECPNAAELAAVMRVTYRFFHTPKSDPSYLKMHREFEDMAQSRVKDVPAATLRMLSAQLGFLALVGRQAAAKARKPRFRHRRTSGWKEMVKKAQSKGAPAARGRS